jgi:ribonuclease Z
MHNALYQRKIELPGLTILGFSISGLATYIQIPELDLCFDMGECPLSSIGLNHIFLSHSHGDHSRCLMRHHALRGMMGIPHKATYYLPEVILPLMEDLVRAEARFEGVPEDRIQLPHFIGTPDHSELIKFERRKDLGFKAFPVAHRVPSQGFTVFKLKKKLKEEFQGKSGKELGALRNEGVILEDPTSTPIVTFIADCWGRSLTEEFHIWKSPVLIIESTFILDGELEMAHKKAHTHIDEIIEILENRNDEIEVEHLILKHFSMKYHRDKIEEVIFSKLPENWKDKVHLLI